MSSYCTIHNLPMIERTSKTKFAPDGSPKTYWAHSSTDGLCFGEGLGKAVRNERYEQINHEVSGGSGAAGGSVRLKDPEAEGKTRCQVAVAFIQTEGIILDSDKKLIMDDWVDWIMTGK